MPGSEPFSEVAGGGSGAASQGSPQPGAAPAGQALPRDGRLGSRPPDISTSVDDLRKDKDVEARSVTAYVLVEKLLKSHPQYGDNRAPLVQLGDAPKDARTETVDDWIDSVRRLFVSQRPGELDGSKLIYGLALLDPELRRRLKDHEFLETLEREKVIDQQLNGRGRALYLPDAVPTLSDRPADIDLLGRSVFAEVLAERLRDEFERSEAERSEAEKGKTSLPGSLRRKLKKTPKPKSKPDPFVLHLEGPWGSGKTSLLGFLERELRKKTEPWVVVDFNAWQNQRAGAPWWLLVSAVLRAAVADTHTKRRQRQALRLRALWWRLQLARAEIAVIVLAAALVIVLAWTGKLSTGDPVGIIAGTIASVVAAASGLHGLVSSVTGGSEKGAQTFISRTRDPMNSLKRRFNGLVDYIHRPIAILIDDLDRCRAAYVVDLLEGVQTIFGEAPVAFVVAADRHWLYDAYAEVYGDYVKTRVDPGRPLGHLFLEKTFQLSTSVPAISPDQQRSFWARLLSPPSKGQQSEAEELARKAEQDFAELRTEDAIQGELDRHPGKTPEERRARREAAVRRLASPTLQYHLEHTLTPLAPLLEPNPRAMKRLVNAYGIERAVQILAGHSAKLGHPRERLALWTILKSRWPLLSDYLSQDPDAVEDLKASRAPDNLPEGASKPYLIQLFAQPAAQRVARGEGLEDVDLDPLSLRHLLESPGKGAVYD